MKELQPSTYTETMDAFTDLLGNALAAALNWKFTGNTQQVRRMREVFYERVQKFSGFGLPPEGNITLEAIVSFDQFREVDWAEEGRVESIVAHYYTIIPRAQE